MMAALFAKLRGILFGIISKINVPEARIIIGKSIFQETSLYTV